MGQVISKCDARNRGPVYQNNRKTPKKLVNQFLIFVQLKPFNGQNVWIFVGDLGDESNELVPNDLNRPSSACSCSQRGKVS